MALEELIGYPYLVRGPQEDPELAVTYGWNGNDTLPTGAEWLCNVDWAPRGEAAAVVLMADPCRPDDLPEGWTATPYEVDDSWDSDDGVWIIKAIHRRADGSWVFAGYCRG